MNADVRDADARFEAALDAWEAANGWLIEPAYARRRLAALDPARFAIIDTTNTPP